MRLITFTDHTGTERSFRIADDTPVLINDEKVWPQPTIKSTPGNPEREPNDEELGGGREKVYPC